MISHNHRFKVFGKEKILFLFSLKKFKAKNNQTGNFGFER